MAITKIPELEIKPSAKRWFNKIVKSVKENGVYSSRVTMTPERAAVLMARNPQNRSIREVKLSQLVSDMKSGLFVFNGESIIVTEDGLLNDGQHRLFASIKSGCSFDTILVVGLSRESRYTIDTGAAKSAGDHLGIQGVANATTAAAIARYVSAWKTNKLFTLRSRISAQEQISMVKEDALLREAAAWVDAQKYRMRDMVKGSLGGFIYYILAEKAPVEAKVFMDQLRLGAGLDARSPIFLAREKLRQNPRLFDNQRIEVIVRAWNHWCRNPVASVSRLVISDTIPEIASPSKRTKGDITDTVAVKHVDDTTELPAGEYCGA